VSAIGLIETKLPDGSDGFSLLVIITADFGPGIQLGFGFTLNAVGGLLGLNRSMLFQAIIDGVRTNAISSVMFPHDVIANAPRIISDLQAFFPPHPGTFLVGPMAKLGWGEPTLVSLSLGVIVEIPPGDIAILGVLRLSLPAEDLPILQLQVKKNRVSRHWARPASPFPGARHDAQGLAPEALLARARDPRPLSS
jgi:hypothetical protein